MSLSAALLSFAGSLAASLAGTGIVLRALTRHAIFDRPNARSSHSGLVPRGGGIAVVSVIVVGWIAVAYTDGESDTILIVAGATLALAGLSWIDDIRDLLPVVRLLGQAASVAFVLVFVPAEGPYFQGLLPPALDRLAAGVLWVWFINLFNFMDGIDGISGVEAASIGTGVAAVAFILGPPSLALYGMAAAGAALGFLWWNWHPAKVFLGDVGSAGLGFALGWLLLTLAASGAWAAAVILPLYYLADATITLLKRLLRGERVWEAHRQHFYQRAVRAGKSHAEIAVLVLLVDVALVGFALVAATGYAWLGLAGAGAVTGALLLYFNTLSPSLSSA